MDTGAEMTDRHQTQPPTQKTQPKTAGRSTSPVPKRDVVERLLTKTAKASDKS
jgi:hypothetical protein